MICQKTLSEQLEAQGYKCRIVSIRRLADLHARIQSFSDQGLLNNDLSDQYFSKFATKPPANMPDAQSLIVMTRMDPAVRFTFHYQGKEIVVTVPPTYLHGLRNVEHAGAVLAGLLQPHGYRALRLFIPHKLLAVCSGLAEYGKNNISYVSGLGSFHRPATFCSDLPCEGDNWRDPVMMPECEKCDRCMRSCPSGAILATRFLIDIDRCITYWNEKPPEVAFPDWLEPSWHNCMVGCMICQRSCPVNKDNLGFYEKGEEFSKEETNMLLSGRGSVEFSQALQEKIDRADLSDLVDILPRNLKPLL